MLSPYAPTRLCLLLIAAFYLPGAVWAQTGATHPTGSDFASSADISAAPAAEEVTGVNDCTAWAISAAKSCAEAYDQGWKPNVPQTMFSPSFIYPQLNGGKDDGSNLIKAALLLVEKGAATLKTTPYLPKDYLTQPSDFAFEEAQRFKNKDAYLLKDQEQIRLALRENLPVVIGARLTPVIFSANFDVYTKEMHDEGMQRRDPKRRHSMHAMVIVGYDDATERFLIRNSWGKNWGKGGHFWVAYDVIDSIDPSEESESFLFLALAMVDEIADVEATPDVGEGIKDTVGLSIRGESAGFDRNFNKTKYRFAANLKTSQAALDLVKEVTWAVPTWSGSIKKLTSKRAERGFRVLSSVGGENHEIGATVTFKDGSSREYKTTTAFQPLPAEDRPISLQDTDFYYGEEWDATLNRKAHRWLREIQVLGPVQDIRDIQRLTIQFGDGEPEDISPGAGRVEISYYTLYATECLPVEVRITFADGTQTVRRSEKTAFTDPADDSIWLRKDVKPVGDGSQSAFSLSTRIPGRIRNGVKHVLWQLDGTQDHFRSETSLRTYFVSGSADRDFRVRATVVFLEMENRPDLVLDEWIELPDGGTAYESPIRVEVDQDSIYLGRDSQNRPEWRYDLRLTGDWEATAKVQGVKFFFHDLDGNHMVASGVRADNGDWLAGIRNMDSSCEVTTQVQSSAGAIELKDSFTSDKPIVDGAFLETQTYQKWGDDLVWTARIGGSHWHEAVDKVAWQYDALFQFLPAYTRDQREAALLEPRPWQSVYSRDEGTLEPRATIRRTTSLPGEITARLYFASGWMETAKAPTTKPVGDWLGPPRDRVQVRMQETYVGTGLSYPFRITFWLDASDEEIAKIDHLLLRHEGNPWSMATRIKPSGRAFSWFDAPGRLVIRIVRKDGSVEQRQIDVTCQQTRPRELELARVGSLILIRGPYGDMAPLRSVGFTIVDGGGAPITKQHKAHSLGGGKFTTHHVSNQTLEVTAELKYDNGRTQVLSAVFHPDAKQQPQYTGKEYFWGWSREKPYWLTAHRALGSAWNDQSDGDYMQVGTGWKVNRSWPDFEFMQAVAKSEETYATIYYRDSTDRKLVVPAVPLQSQPSKALTVQVARTWENPGQDPHARDEFLFRIVGPMQQLDEVLHVDYTLRYKNGEKNWRNTWHETSRWSLDGDGFRGLTYTHEMVGVEAKLTYRDGRDAKVLHWKAR
ncbi:MAG: C1 family peptidase [Planctomycetota bacterium]|nr:C1 family peptidase [Planctomycetota bacterium]